MSNPIKKVFDYEFGKDNKTISRLILYSASALANTLTYPLELVKQRMMTSRHDKYSAPLYRNPKACFKEIYGLRGVRGFYQGMSVSLLQNLIGLSITDFSFDWFEAKDTGIPILQSVYTKMLFSCSLAEALLYPLDTIKYCNG